MILKVIDNARRYAELIDDAPPRTGESWERRLFEECRSLYPNFSEPYLSLSIAAMQIEAGAKLSRGYIIGSGDGIDLLVSKFEELLSNPIFGDDDVRFVLNFSEDHRDEILRRASTHHEIERKKLPHP